MALKPGDLAEYSAGASTRLVERSGELTTVIELRGDMTLARFPDGEEIEVYTSCLTWVPSLTEIDSGKAALKAKFIDERRGLDSLVKGGPKVKVIQTGNGRRKSYRSD